MLGYVPENRRLRAATNCPMWLSIRSRARLAEPVRLAVIWGQQPPTRPTEPQRTSSPSSTSEPSTRPRQHPRVSRRDEAGTGPLVGQRDSVQPGQAHLVDRQLRHAHRDTTFDRRLPGGDLAGPAWMT
jgi:hypothetical protein